MTLQNNSSSPSEASELGSFIEGVCISDPFKVEQDLGHGYVKLRSTEAEKRQAAQDITCVEDIIIELLRNSRDAGAKNIFVATAKEAGERTLVVIDDGTGIPQAMWETIFEPRVTSKLETAHMDKWGMHGRGMALYSIRVHSLVSKVVNSVPDLGTALLFKTDTELPEKADQSTLPFFELQNGTVAMRGPKNILRICSEFALEHKNEVNVYVGSPSQIAAALYAFGMATIPAYQRAFTSVDALPILKRLALSATPEALALAAAELGLDISPRTARRIADGKIDPPENLFVIMQERAAQQLAAKPSRKRNQAKKATSPSIHLSPKERSEIASAVKNVYASLADAYYLESDVDPIVRIVQGKLIVEVPLIASDEGA